MDETNHQFRLPGADHLVGFGEPAADSTAIGRIAPGTAGPELDQAILIPSVKLLILGILSRSAHVEGETKLCVELVEEILRRAPFARVPLEVSRSSLALLVGKTPTGIATVDRWASLRRDHQWGAAAFTPGPLVPGHREVSLSAESSFSCRVETLHESGDFAYETKTLSSRGLQGSLSPGASTTGPSAPPPTIPSARSSRLERFSTGPSALLPTIPCLVTAFRKILRGHAPGVGSRSACA